MMHDAPAGATLVRRRRTASFAHGTSWPAPPPPGATGSWCTEGPVQMGRELRCVMPCFDPVQRDCCCVAGSRCDRPPVHMGRAYDTILHAARDAELERHTGPSKGSMPVE